MNTLENALKTSSKGACTNDFQSIVWYDEKKDNYFYCPDMSTGTCYPRLDGDRYTLDLQSVLRLAIYSTCEKWISIDHAIDHLAHTFLTMPSAERATKLIQFSKFHHGFIHAVVSRMGEIKKREEHPCQNS